MRYYDVMFDCIVVYYIEIHCAFIDCLLTYIVKSYLTRFSFEVIVLRNGEANQKINDSVVLDTND